MIKAVLFDLDETLLDINLALFSARYGLGMARVLSDITRYPLPLVTKWLVRCYLEVDRQDRTDGLTNQHLLETRFLELSGVPLDDPAIADAVAYYDLEYIRRFHGAVLDARPRPGARRTIERAQELGLRVALATNPVFSIEADMVRMDWAGLKGIAFDRVSTMANSTRTKPCATYYQEFCTKLGVAPSECLMVGNDASRDFPRPDVGMRTAYVGHAWPRRAVWRGRIGELGGHLPQIVAMLNEEAERSAPAGRR